jgi:hypothetical protein
LRVGQWRGRRRRAAAATPGAEVGEDALKGLFGGGFDALVDFCSLFGRSRFERHFDDH